MNEHLSKILNHSLRTPVITGVVSFGAGVVTGYFLRRKPKPEPEPERHVVPRNVGFGLVLDEQAFMEANSNDEPEDITVVIEADTSEAEEALRAAAEGMQFINARFNDIHEVKPSEDDSPWVEQKQNITRMVDNVVVNNVVVDGKPELVEQNVFAEHGDRWNFEEEVAKRSSDQPYIIHKDEFFAEENEDYRQSTLTYYAGDDIMVDEDDTPMYNYSGITGPLIFGHGSDQPNVVYVRNERRKAEYEIMHDPGLYSVEILGLELEDNDRVKNLKHSSSPVQKFRLNE